MKLKEQLAIGSLFSGIGGLELGLQSSGIGRTVWQVEKSEFCRRVLERHWPGVERFEDVKECGEQNLPHVDLICGGFPCQDVSAAGKGAGLAGERSGLWFEFARIVGELRPQWVVVENVASGASRWVDAVMAGLAKQDYQAVPFPLSAADVGAPHLRRRIFVVAHANSYKLRKQPGRRRGQGGGETAITPGDGAQRAATNPNSKRSGPRGAGGVIARDKGRRPAQQKGRVARAASHAKGEQMGRPGLPREKTAWMEGPPVPPVCRMDDGIPNMVDRIRALGNAVVPQCAEVIGHVIRWLE